jgi:hypothetical protein
MIVNRTLIASLIFVGIGSAGPQLHAGDADEPGQAQGGGEEAGKQKSGAKGREEPVDGISLRQYAWGTARLGQGVALDSVVKDLGSTTEKWNHANKVWLQRMKDDRTFKVSTDYGKYYLEAGQGKYGAQGKDSAAAMQKGGKPTGKEPFSFEKWIQITQHQTIAVSAGIPAATILRQYNMNASDWGTASWWWSQKFNREAREDNGKLLARFNELTEKYSKQYKKQYGVGGAAKTGASP